MGQSSRATHQVIMFADIAGSTALYERLGDTEARALVAACLARMGAIVTAKGGRIAAELGDELMCFLDSPGDAAAAACDMHSTVAVEFPEAPPRPALELRIGMHYGAVHGHKDDLLSEAAKIAHWAASKAKRGQTLATVSLIDALPRIYRAVSRYVDDETWNFVSFEHVTLYEIIWDIESVTASSLESGAEGGDRYARVTFRIEGDTIELSAERPVMSVGRGTQNDLVVKHDLVSRQHFTAQFSRGRCTITDKSTNGTFVVSPERARHAVRRDTYPLEGEGVIVLGHPTAEPADCSIRYVCS